MNNTIHIDRYYGSLSGMLKKFEKNGRKNAFTGKTTEEFEAWKGQMRTLLADLLGLENMENCPLDPIKEEIITLPSGIIREKVILQVEPEVYMPVFILIPEGQEKGIFLALPGHQGAGKYSVAGCREIPAVNVMIDHYNYDYGMKLAEAGYVAVCPDCRGFGERRDEDLQNDEEAAFLNSTCFQLAHMAEPLGETVAGMCTWDAMRLIDYLEMDGRWDLSQLGCVGFSGGGMQTMWLTALDDRVTQAIISGYLYGYKDSLLILNGNCSCNYVPHLYEHLDMGDITSLIAPRKLTIQSCREDHLNGYRGLKNVEEQMEILKKAYALYDKESLLKHNLQDGDHCFYPEVLQVHGL